MSKYRKMELKRQLFSLRRRISSNYPSSNQRWRAIKRLCEKFFRDAQCRRLGFLRFRSRWSETGLKISKLWKWLCTMNQLFSYESVAEKKKETRVTAKTWYHMSRYGWNFNPRMWAKRTFTMSTLRMAEWITPYQRVWYYILVGSPHYRHSITV